MRLKNSRWTMVMVGVIGLLMVGTMVWASPPAGAPSTALQAYDAKNADKVDGLHASKRRKANTLLALNRRSKFPGSVIPGAITRDKEVMGIVKNNDGAGSGLDADQVDGYHASAVPSANKLIALDGSAYLRVPRMLDSNNTSYYVDPAISSNLFTVYGQQFGVGGSSRADSGYYVTDSAGNDVDHGVYVDSVDDNGVYVASSAHDGVHIASATGDGVEIESASWGIYAPHNTTCGAYFYESTNGIEAEIAYRSGGTNYGILSNGTKAFMQQHPTDPDQVIIYASLEGGEVGTYYRGTAQLEKGTAVIELPEHFGLVTEEEGLTVQVTPRQDCKGLYVVQVTTSRIVVKELQGGTSNAHFDFLINGIRAGYKDFKVLNTVSAMGLEEAH